MRDVYHGVYDFSRGHRCERSDLTHILNAGGAGVLLACTLGAQLGSGEASRARGVQA